MIPCPRCGWPAEKHLCAECERYLRQGLVVARFLRRAKCIQPCNVHVVPEMLRAAEEAATWSVTLEDSCT